MPETISVHCRCIFCMENASGADRVLLTATQKKMKPAFYCLRRPSLLRCVFILHHFGLLIPPVGLLARAAGAPQEGVETDLAVNIVHAVLVRLGDALASENDVHLLKGKTLRLR